jgi:lipoyl(octanoyl) transferase
MQPQLGNILSFGSMPYQRAWDLQRTLVQRRRDGLIPDTLILLEHPPVYTLGRSGGDQNILFTPAERRSRGIDLIRVDRGGDITYHGPGQLVGYPIVDLRHRGGDVHRYLRDIESVLIRVLAGFGLVGERDERYTGVWIAGRKIAAIGVKVTHGVTSHGFALNVCPNMEHWAGIIPCGIAQRGVVSLSELMGGDPIEVDTLRAPIAKEFGRVFGLDVQPLASNTLGEGDAIAV